MSTSTRITSWIFRILAAFIMLQTLFFKFTGAEESIYIFSKLCMEPWGRFGTGIAELMASCLLLIPRTTWLGAVIGAGSMSGAIFFHLTRLGIEIMGDGGQLFIYALVTLVSCIGLLLFERQKVQQLFNRVFSN